MNRQQQNWCHARKMFEKARIVQKLALREQRRRYEPQQNNPSQKIRYSVSQALHRCRFEAGIETVVVFVVRLRRRWAFCNISFWIILWVCTHFKKVRVDLRPTELFNWGFCLDFQAFVLGGHHDDAGFSFSSIVHCSPVCTGLKGGAQDIRYTKGHKLLLSLLQVSLYDTVWLLRVIVCFHVQTRHAKWVSKYELDVKSFA